MRDLSLKIQRAVLRDGFSDETHVFFYRQPTNQERLKYASSLIQRRGSKIVNMTQEVRQKFGADIITGFEKGTLGYDGAVFASDANDPDYREDWKQLLIEHAGDLVSAIAARAFEGTSFVDPNLEIGAVEDSDSDPT